MQSKLYNSYRITHENGSIENINAKNLIEALNNMEISEDYSPVLQTYMQEKGIRTLVSDMPEEIPFTCAVAEGSGGSIATPLSGTVHAGDQLAFKAIPATGYQFVNWKMNGQIISDQASFVYTFPELNGEASAVFVATFRLAPVNYQAVVEPAEATSAGCLTFPPSGTVEANGTIGVIAVADGNYTFDHWEKDGETISTNKILSATVAPLSEGETSAIYKAVFTLNEA